MELRYLKLVKAVAEEGTLTKATNKLFLTQSALSHQVKEIEKMVGTPVFLRVNKQFVLTDAGKILYNTAQEVLGALDRFDSELKKSLKGEIGKIRLCTECYTCYHWLPPILKNYSYGHPNIEVIVNTDNISKPLDHLLNAKLDIAIIHRIIDNDNIDFQELFEDELVLVVSRDHSLNKKKYIYAKDFENEVLITHTQNYKGLTVFERVLNPENVKPRKVIYIQITEAIIEMVKSGLGVAVMAKWAMKPYIESRKINVIPITRKGLWRKWFLASIKNKNRPAYLSDFIDEVKKGAKL